jgi:restriction system protein
MAETQVFWGFHIYAEGDALVQKGYLAVGWSEMECLSTIPATREGFKAKVAGVYKTQTQGWVANQAGQLYRFVHEMKQGDTVVYRSKIDKQIHLGKVSGDYEHRPDLSQDYPNMRAVKWLKTVAATQFSQGALYELGSALTLFQVKNYAQEYEDALKGEMNTQAAGDDETVGIVAEEVEQTTRDFILKQLAQNLKGYPFQGFVANLLVTMGYRTQLQPKGADEGVDIIAHKDELKLEPPIIKVQVKSGDGSVGRQEVQQLLGNLGDGEFGLLVALGGLSPQAKDFAKRKTNLRLVDGPELVDLVLEHYEALDPRYKSFIPLKKVYIPEPVQDKKAMATHA